MLPRDLLNAAGACRRAASISTCGRFRFALRRIWEPEKPLVLIIGLNPSTADATHEDQTSRVCMNFARRWGYGGLLIGNLFAYRATNPRDLRRTEDPVGPRNDDWLKRLQSQAELVVCAWGDTGGFRSRDEEVLGYLRHPHCMTRLKSGRPGHPLYKPAHLTPRPLMRANVGRTMRGSRFEEEMRC